MKSYNIPIFIPHLGCPFDCVFCNQRRITGAGTDVTPDDVRRIIEERLTTLPESGASIEAAFFGGSFTGIPMEQQSALMAAVQPYIRSGRISGIRMSTRPDYITREILDNLMYYGATTIELGVQSMDDEVLKAAARGHSAEQVRQAAALIHEYPIRLGLQMMTGLPGDTPERSIYTARELIRLRSEIVRIYPTLTIRDTYMEKMYREGRYTPQTLDEAVELCKTLVLMFEAENIRVIRLGLQSTDEISEHGSVVAGPVHSSFGELVESAIYLDKMLEVIPRDSRVTVYVARGEISKAVGNRKRNIELIKQKLDTAVKVAEDDELTKREVRAVVS